MGHNLIITILGVYGIYAGVFACLVLSMIISEHFKK
jgi:hypothetical protein